MGGGGDTEGMSDNGRQTQRDGDRIHRTEKEDIMGVRQHREMGIGYTGQRRKT